MMAGGATEELHAIGAALLEAAQPDTALVRRVDRLQHVVDCREVGVGQKSRRRDRVLGRTPLLVEHPSQAVHRAHLANGGHAVRQPELVDIVDRRHPAVRCMVGDAGMGVAVDEAGRHPLAAAIDLVIAGRNPVGGRREIARHLLHQGDPVALDHDVGRPDRRGAGAVDHRGAAQHQALEGADAAVTGGRRRDGRLACLGPVSRQLVAGERRGGDPGIGHGLAPQGWRAGRPPMRGGPQDDDFDDSRKSGSGAPASRAA